MFKYQFEVEEEIKNCYSCPCTYETLEVCCGFKHESVEDYEETKPDWCPLEKRCKE